MENGVILKAISGFYYVVAGDETIECRARGRLRREKIVPLVGDRVEITILQPGKGVLNEVLPRRNAFVRPPVANLDQLVIIAAAAIPITDPFLIDRMSVIAAHNDCDFIVCVNKCDIDSGDKLYEIYSRAGFNTIKTSAVTGEGISKLSELMKGKISAFTGNSGVGKSSILNALEPGFQIKTGEVSQKLGRGRHITRHVELYKLQNGAIIADTPGFSSFDIEGILKDDLQFGFVEFANYLGDCRFKDCAHIKEPDCGILDALESGDIHPSRHASYVRLYEQLKQIKEWEV